MSRSAVGLGNAGHRQRRQGHRRIVGRKGQSGAAVRRDLVVCRRGRKRVQQQGRVEIHAGGDQLGHRIEQLIQAVLGSIQRYDKMLAFAQNAADPAAANVARPMFNEDAHAVVVGRVNHPAEIDARRGLVGQRSRH